MLQFFGDLEIGEMQLQFAKTLPDVDPAYTQTPESRLVDLADANARALLNPGCR